MTDFESDSTVEQTVLSGRGRTWQDKERMRLKDIEDYQLDNHDINDKGLQAITNLAANLTDMPLSFITLVKDTYVPFLSRSGCDLTGTGRENSFCDLAIEQSDFFEVTDSTVDPRFVENVFVKGQETPLTYYGGWPIKTPNGNHLGSLCVCDFKKRQLNESQKVAIKTLADQVLVHLELKKNNRKLEEALKKAEKLSKAKDDFVSNMSHELRTPLNAINGFAEILSKSNLDFEQKDAVGIISNSCEILITLVNDILDFSKIESGKLAIEKIPFNLHKATKNIRDLLGKKAEEKNNNLILEIDQRLPISLLGDKVRINQIIVNLVGNALKFTEKGTVTLSVNVQSETESDITLDFSVKDTGIGIPEDKLDSIFERFEQVGVETTRKYGGTGLGLNISRNLIELHGGKLKVRSKLGEGSEFYFTITYDKINDADELKKGLLKGTKKSADIELLNNTKLLICEDNIVNIKLFRNLFKNRPNQIQIAENGKIAIEILKKNKKFDAILMDIHMPEMGGIEATKYIRKILKLKIPIIGFTANSSKTERDICLATGMNDYVTKTFVPEDFYEKISKALPKKKVYAEDIIEVQVPKRKCTSNRNSVTNFHNEHERNITRSPKTRKNNSSRSLHKFIKDECFLKNNFNENLFDSDVNIAPMISSKFSLNNNQSAFFSGEEESKESSTGMKMYTSDKFVDFKEEEPVIDIFNPEKLKEISGEDVDFENEVIALFLDDFPRQLDSLEEAIRNMNEEGIKFSVHKMKSPLSMFGFDSILEKLHHIEEIFYKENSGFLIKEFFKVTDDVEAAFKQLKNYVSSLTY